MKARNFFWTKYPIVKWVPEDFTFYVEVLAWDENKYVLVRWLGHIFSMKAAYLCPNHQCERAIELKSCLDFPGWQEFWKISQDNEVVSA